MTNLNTKLPTAVVAVLGVIATALALIQPTLGSPWYEVVAAVIALGTAAGVWGVRASIKGALPGSSKRRSKD